MNADDHTRMVIGIGDALAPADDGGHDLRRVSLLRRRCDRCGAEFRVTARGRLEHLGAGASDWTEVSSFAAAPCRQSSPRPA